MTEHSKSKSRGSLTFLMCHSVKALHHVLIILPLKVLLIVAMVLVAIANGEECGQDPYSMSGCQIMKKGSQGKPDRSEMGAMISSVENIGCPLPSRGSRSELFQGVSEQLISSFPLLMFNLELKLPLLDFFNSWPCPQSVVHYIQGLADMMQCVVDSCEGQQDKCMDDEMYSMVKMDVEDAIMMMENMALAD